MLPDYYQLKHAFNSGTDDDAFLGQANAPKNGRLLNNAAAAAFTPLWSATRRLIGDKPYDWREPERRFQSRFEPPAITSRGGFEKLFQLRDKINLMPKSKTGKGGRGGRRPRGKPRSQTAKFFRLGRGKKARATQKARKPSRRRISNPVSRKNYLASARRVTAPLGVAYTVTGSGFEFTAGRRPGCMRMRSKIYIGDLVGQNTASSGTPVFNSGILLTDVTNTVQLIHQWYLNPFNSYYVGNGPLSPMSSMFRLYYVNGASLEFDATCPSNTPGNLTWCAPMSIDYWDTLYGSDSTVPSNADILNIPNSKGTSVWVKSTLALPVDRKQKFWMTSPDGKAGNFQFSDPIADQRMTYAATVGLRISDFLDPGYLRQTTFGRVFLHIDLELCDMTTAIVDAVSFSDKFKGHGPRPSGVGQSRDVLQRLSFLEGKYKGERKLRSLSPQPGFDQAIPLSEARKRPDFIFTKDDLVDEELPASSSSRPASVLSQNRKSASLK